MRPFSDPPHPSPLFVCLFAQRLAPEYAVAATKLKETDADVIIAKVDATAERALGERFGVRGYPTLKWFIDGKEAAPYEGGRSANEIVAWVTKRSGPATKPLASVEELEALTSAGGSPLVIAYVSADEAGAPVVPAVFESVALKSDAAEFYTTTDAALAEKLGLKEAGSSFAVVRRYPNESVEIAVNEGHPAFADVADVEAADVADALASFVSSEVLPAYLEFNRETAPRIFSGDYSQQVLLLAPPSAFEAGASGDEVLRAAAPKLRGSKVVLVAAPAGGEGTNSLFEYFGVEETLSEIVAIGYDTKLTRKYRFPLSAELEAEALVKFAFAVKEGSAERLLKSAPTPEEPLENGVRVVTGNTFDEIVKDPTRDVLLEVYAPWCGHCKSLAPHYEKLAARFETVDSVVIAKMDGTKNEHADINIQGFPTIFFFPAAKAGETEAPEPVVYGGGRTYKDLLKYVKDNANSEFTLPKKSKKAEAKAKGDHDEL